MDTSQKTTEFSAHLSWAAMRRFLQEKLSPEASQRVEVHLQNCSRCSSAIIDYIQTEEPQNYKLHMKKLKGKLTSSQTAKKRFLSAFQLKAIRTTTAVIALLVFSFFALKTVISQQGAERSLPSESLATMKTRTKAPSVRRKAVRISTSPTTQEAAAPEETPKKQKKKPSAKEAKQRSPQPAQKVAEKDKQPEVKPTPVPPAARVVEKAPKKQPQAPTAKEVHSSKTTTSSPNRQEKAAVEEPIQEVAKAKPLPTLKKLDTQKSEISVAPISKSQPAATPIPNNQIRER